MQKNFNDAKEKNAVLDSITYLVGSKDVLTKMQELPAKSPFDEEIIEFLNDVSRLLMNSKEAKAYPDIITLAFWLRKSSVIKLKERFYRENGNIYMGRGMAFHIAPSNVPVNYAYSFAAGLMTGNSNVVRIPSKDFPQVKIINQAIRRSLEQYEGLKPYICLVRYGHSKEVNDFLSARADTRIIWGGDATIAELRQSPLSPRAGEIAFADRFSLAVIDSDRYMEENKERLAEGFYNDTYLTDQNACTSPHIVIWTGSRKEEAKDIFWNKLHELAVNKYTFQAVQAINKLTSAYLTAALRDDVKIQKQEDNFLVRVQVTELKKEWMDLKDNSGYFLEYDCEDILELSDLCRDKRCQTIAYIGKKEMLIPLLKAGIKGIDRVVPVGKTMDFDFIWDGYNLFERLTREIVLA